MYYEGDRDREQELTYFGALTEDTENGRPPNDDGLGGQQPPPDYLNRIAPYMGDAGHQLNGHGHVGDGGMYMGGQVPDIGGLMYEGEQAPNDQLPPDDQSQPDNFGYSGYELPPSYFDYGGYEVPPSYFDSDHSREDSPSDLDDEEDEIDDGIIPLSPVFRGPVNDETRDASFIRGNASNWQRHVDAEHDGAGPKLETTRTRYFDDQEQANAEISVQNGLLTNADGQLMDTTAASGTGTHGNSGQGKHIFAMTPDDDVRAVDPWAAKQINTTESGQTSLDFTNHSSLVAGGGVAAAGELTVEQGQLQQISDGSGHYRPQGQHVRHALEHFQGEGVDTHDTGVRMVGKNAGERPLIASSREFMGHSDANQAENQMRARRAALSSELSTAVGQRQQRLGQDPSSWEH